MINKDFVLKRNLKKIKYKTIIKNIKPLISIFNLFSYYSSLISLNLSNHNINNCINMSNKFSNCFF